MPMPFSETMAETTHTEEIVTFVDNAAHWEYSVDTSPDATFNVADTNDASLENFFSRPVKIDSFSWPVGGALDHHIDPWSKYLNNTRVLNRISNYKLLRGKLHIKIVINGNKFYYGMLLASYSPLFASDNVTLTRSTVPADLVAASQKPHIYIQPTCCKGGEMILPFVWQTNAFDITTGDWNSSAMGSIWYRSMNLLQHANGGTENITVNTFAWMEDVSLSIPTSVDVSGILPQAGVLDEYSGPVSGPLNVVCQAAGALTKVPVLAPYAKASQLVSSGLAMIAKFLGYSRPVDIQAIHSYKPTYLGNVSNSNVPDTCQKLTYDVKQETVVDSRVCGLSGRDEMGLLSIAQRESYLCGCTWTLSSAVDTQLFNSKVNPTMFTTAVDPLFPTQTEYHLTPLAFASLPFKYWRGSIRFRFQVIASDFHKGRLRVLYDPSGNSGALSEYNLCYSRIIDISETKDFTVDIGWGQKYPYLDVNSIVAVPFTVGSSPATGSPGIDNGVISLSVVNELSAPSSSTVSVGINVFVSAGEDFELFNPTTSEIDLIAYARQGPAPAAKDMVPQAGELVTEESKPTAGPADSMAPALSHTDRTIEVFSGDPVSSIRQILKRYNYSSSFLSTPTVYGSKYLASHIVSNFPHYRGYVPGALYANGTSSENFNYCRNTMLNYFTPAYLCRRGGIRWKYHVLRDFESAKDSYAHSFWAARTPEAIIRSATYTAVDYSTVGKAAKSGLQPTFDTGAVVTAPELNPVLEVELPFQENRRFFIGRTLNMTTDNAQKYHEVGLLHNANHLINAYCASAEDFDLSFFLSVPVMWKYADPTAS